MVLVVASSANRCCTETIKLDEQQANAFFWTSDQQSAVWRQTGSKYHQVMSQIHFLVLVMRTMCHRYNEGPEVALDNGNSILFALRPAHEIKHQNLLSTRRSTCIWPALCSHKGQAWDDEVSPLKGKAQLTGLGLKWHDCQI
jgi:hypothetical protein